MPRFKGARCPCHGLSSHDHPAAHLIVRRSWGALEKSPDSTTLDRLVVLVPCVGSAEVLPSTVLPTDVLAAGPILSSSIARDKELFWSMGGYHFQEVNELASALAGHTVKGDVCIVQTFSRDALRFPYGPNLNELLKEWRSVAKLRRQAHGRLEESSFGPHKAEDSISTTVEKHGGMMSGAPITTDVSLMDVRNSYGALSIPQCHQASFSRSEAEPANADSSENNHEGMPHSESPPSSPQRMQSTNNELYFDDGESRRDPLDLPKPKFGSNQQMAAAKAPAQHWDELHPDMLCRIAHSVDSGKMVVVMSGVSPHWRQCIISDAALLRSIPFRLNLSRPLRIVNECREVIEKTLHRRHIGSLPKILRKAADLNNVDAISCLANIYHSCSMHVDAVQQCRKLSRMGDLHGSWRYGEALYNGRGIGRDAEAAQRVLLKVGKQILQSDDPTMGEMLRGVGLCLGYLFLDGEAGKQDNEKAVQWFQIAAKNGCPEAEITLGWMFNTGQYG